GRLERHQHLVFLGNLAFQHLNGFNSAANLGPQANLLNFDDSWKGTRTILTAERPEIPRRTSGASRQQHDDRELEGFQEKLRKPNIKLTRPCAEVAGILILSL